MDLKEKKQLLLEMKKKYLALKRNIPNDIRQQIHSDEVIQGARSLQAQLPNSKKTLDYDIYSKAPKESATRIKEFLNREFGGAYFKIKAGQHRGTYKVKSTIDDETYADFTRLPKRAKITTVGETQYSSLEFERMKALRTLRKEKFKYRHRKEHGRLRRIQSYLKSKWF